MSRNGVAHRGVLAGAVIVCAIALAGCGGYPGRQQEEVATPRPAPPPVTHSETQVIPIVLSTRPEFSTLVKAIDLAGLTATLEGPGPFTVFAPDNEAFGKLPRGRLEELMKPENREELRAILTYHVVPEELTVPDIAQRGTLPTLNGKELTVQLGEGEIAVHGADLMGTEVQAANGVIYAIDAVMIPGPEKGL